MADHEIMIPSIQLIAEEVTLRLMQPDDLPALHEIYRSNVPEFFPENTDPVDELNEEAPNYFVAESKGRVIGGGGINLGQTGEQSLLYLGMVHREFHRRGIGSLLMLARLAWTDGDPGLVWAIAPLQAAGFFQRFGFEPMQPPAGRRMAEGSVRLARWVYQSDRDQINDQLRSLPFRDLTLPEEGGEDLPEE
jgi:N-acetylglutamate synthase-like GNAT family acetyltransferase